MLVKRILSEVKRLKKSGFFFFCISVFYEESSIRQFGGNDYIRKSLITND